MKYQYGFPSVSLKKAFEKSLLKISQINIRENIRQAIEKLADNPRPFGTKPFKQLLRPLDFMNILPIIEFESEIIGFFTMWTMRRKLYGFWH